MSRDILKLDSQALNTYQQCPRKFFWSFKRNIEPVKRKTALSMGGVMHDLFEFVNTGLIEKRDELRNLILEALQTVDMSEVSSEERALITKRFLEYFNYWQVEDSKYELVACEKGFSKTIYEDSNVLFVYEGRIDALFYHNREQVYVWRDYKTHSGQKLYKHTNQFYGYTWALTEYGCRGEIDYIGKNKTFNPNEPSKTFEREIVKFHQSQVDRWVVRAIDTFYDIYRDTRYHERMSACQGKYGVCSFHTLCERDPSIHESLIQINYKEKEKWSAW